MRFRTRTTALARIPRTATLAAALLGLLLPLFAFGAPAHAAAPGFRIENGRLLERSGNDFVMRGVNHAHTWYPNQMGSLAHIKAKGANTVRVVLSSGDRWTRNDTADVTNVVTQCKRNRLICVLEVHDTTGYGEQSGSVTLSRAADYWIGVQSALTGQEDHVIVNIGNEPYGNNHYAGWTADTKAAIQKLRTAGFDHTIMVDAPNWGQDWAFTMRDNAASVFAADPDANTIFSIHMYGVFDTAAEVNDYLNRFVSARLPIVVGEFGHDHSDGNPDEDAILATTQRLGLGYLGWSWSGNGGGVEYLDMVTNFDPNQLTSWGQRLFNGANGIAATSREAAIYSSSGGDTTPPTTPGTPSASAVTSSSATLTWSAATDATGVTGYDVVRVNGTTETAATTTTGTSATLTGLSPATSYGFAVYARDAAGNRSARSGTVTVTTSSGGSTAACAIGYRVTGTWSGGFQGEVVIRNTGTSAVDGWTLRWTFPDSQRVSSLWGGTVAQSGAAVTVTAASYTANIPAAGSATLGFTATRGSANPAPTAFTLNGAACTTT
ncbi:cellulase family glycosylhydrolase [Streptomyces europaeiscabiei]|uniref:Endoglucanase n=1 Tax=Streptomyces europaeiscabiei TaxID=146819 RepID=A0ABU4NNC3_9ACTN|nr:cellulase family glycosylhydrolase [Streptomyces europaeiscabiei]MDX2529052.1 cellulase family glycosylhydrolase [Streptomyces europaeiscabiei]MDX2767212.1 cellulase family glycosylhydrolase [Streptomyces europaeiscabiei]MDX3546642.1 cellulase family glycosylhydrolase [Streptomyces europaeiscabiei]MDX3556336.1 cellulase family glycosylhydrolase [Streptomyces europaeiscabiei]MDX3704175.1 cellulase family glycosylhydrolase [Streptomyces europaeiscabiei]